MGLNIAFYGSSIVSALWNGAATYYRGLIRALNLKGHNITFYEPDIYDRQKNRDIDDPEWCKVVVYQPNDDEINSVLNQSDDADIIIKASGIGYKDEYFESAVLNQRKSNQAVIFLDVDAPATLNRVKNDPNDPFRELIPQYDIILTYGGGEPVSNDYIKLGAKNCVPIYNALDTSTHYPVTPRPEWICDLGFLGNRLPDREQRVDDFFLYAAQKLPDKKFLLGGSGWGDKNMSSNVNYVGHVFTKDHNAFNSSPKNLLNISRQSMVDYGYSPATRIFEAAGSAGCIITDNWPGIEHFFVPGKEILIINNGDELVDLISKLDEDTSIAIGEAAYKKVISKHTYANRADQLELILKNIMIDINRRKYDKKEETV